MTAVRLIQDGIRRPGPLAYFTTATLTAMLVLVVAGYRAHSSLAEDVHLPPDIAYARNARPAGMVPASTRLSPSASIDESTIHVDATAGVLQPDHLLIRAGLPARISFTMGHRCTSQVFVESLGLSAIPGHGGALLRVPPLQRGVYPITCVHGSAIGLLIAR